MLTERLMMEQLDEYSKYKNLYLTISDLVSVQGRDSIREYIIDNNINKIIIYGAGTVGRIFYDVVNEINKCSIIGVIDNSKTTEFGLHNFISVEELYKKEYDMIVITPLSALRKIEEDLEKNNITKFCYVSEMVDYVGRKKLYENDILI